MTLSIVIVSYNAKAYLDRCLQSLRQAVYDFSVETIVVDNASRDGSADLVEREYPEVRLIRSRSNLGFAKGNNLGIRRCRGRYVLLLNSDTEVWGDALGTLVGFLDGHQDVGVVSGRVVYPDMTDQGVARAFPTPVNVFFGRRSLLTRLFPNNALARAYMISRSRPSDDPFEVDWVSGACLMVRKAVLDDVGLLDERFFMYWEDADLCYRIKQRQWRVYCVPEAVVIHHEGKSSPGPGSTRLILEFNRSAYRYYRKHHVASVYQFRNLAALGGITVRTFVLMLAHWYRRALTASARTERNEPSGAGRSGEV